MPWQDSTSGQSSPKNGGLVWLLICSNTTQYLFNAKQKSLCLALVRSSSFTKTIWKRSGDIMSQTLQTKRMAARAPSPTRAFTPQHLGTYWSADMTFLFFKLLNKIIDTRLNDWLTQFLFHNVETGGVSDRARCRIPFCDAPRTLPSVSFPDGKAITEKFEETKWRDAGQQLAQPPYSMTLLIWDIRNFAKICSHKKTAEWRVCHHSILYTRSTENCCQPTINVAHDQMGGWIGWWKCVELRWELLARATPMRET